MKAKRVEKKIERGYGGKSHVHVPRKASRKSVELAAFRVESRS